MKILTRFTALMLLVSIIVYFAGCKGEDELLPRANADFTYTLNEDTGTVTFLNTSSNATKFVWDFGDGQTSTEINPVKTYPAGSYTVRLTASNVSGASDFVEVMIVIVIPDVFALPITFDNSNVDYEPTVFNGAAFAVVDNPSQSGTNDKETKVGAITNSGVAFEGLFFDLGSAVDLTTNKSITMNFRSLVATTVLLKLEEGTGGALEVTSSHGGSGWEKLTFDFTSSAAYSRLTLFVDGPGTTAGTFYMDDIMQEAITGGGGGCAGTLVAAPSIPVDFEGCATFLSSENFGSGITSELIANPFKTGINTSNFVLKVDKPTGSDFFAGIQNTFASNFNLTTTNTFKVKVYSTKANVVFRFELAVNPQTVPVTGNPAPVFKTITTANVWTEVSVTFTGLPGGPTAYNQLVIKPDNTQTDSPITAGGTYYIDDLTLSAGAETSPSTPAPTPPARVATDVISIFSNAYTNITGVDYNPNWGQATVTTTIDVAGNATLKYAGLNYQGTDWAGNVQNVSAMGFLHVDFWTANSTALNVFLISTAAGAEKLKVLTVPTNGNWTSIDIPLTDFTPTVDLANVIQFKFEGNGDIFLDNLYFYRTGPPPTAPTTAAPTPPVRAAGDVISLFSDAYTNVTVDTWRTPWSAADFEDVLIAGNATKKYSNLDFVGVETFNPKINATDMTHIHVDVWSANFTQFSVKLVNFGTATTEHQVDFLNPAQGSWIGYDIPLSSFTGLASRSDLAQYIFVGRPIAANTIFMDNIYFYKSSGGGGGGNLITNGGFETGNDTGWIFINNNGTVSVTNTQNNGGSFSGRIDSNPFGNPGIKQERFGAGTVLPNTQYEVKFDIRQQTLIDGAVVNAFTFSENNIGNAAVQHALAPIILSAGNWSSNTFTFTTAADVSGGLSLLIEVVCGGAGSCDGVVFIDNISLTKK